MSGNTKERVENLLTLAFEKRQFYSVLSREPPLCSRRSIFSIFKLIMGLLYSLFNMCQWKKVQINRVWPVDPFLVWRMIRQHIFSCNFMRIVFIKPVSVFPTSSLTEKVKCSGLKFL